MVRVIPQPSTITTIGEKRGWIMTEAAKDVSFAWMLDDDLKFKMITEGNFRTPRDPASWANVWNYITEKCVWHKVMGLGTSYFAPKGGCRDNYHLGFAFGFDLLTRGMMEWGRLDVFEDIDYTLQTLKMGFSNKVYYDIVVDQVKAAAPGGCADERTLETIRRDFDKLCTYHPGIVSEKPLRPGAHPAAITRVRWREAARMGGLV